MEVSRMKYCSKCNRNYSDKIKKCPECDNKLVKVAY